LLRVKGELFLLQSSAAVRETAEDLFRQALDAARRDKALPWELRAAVSLARLLHTQGRSADGLAILQPVYQRFTEGFDTADLKSVKGLLAALGQTSSRTTRDALAGRPPVRGRRRTPATDLG
jgi:predicted ATPase